jgi:flagellar hook-associated protein 3 FlgL
VVSRVTQNLLVREMLTNFSDLQRRLGRAQQEVGSGRRLHEASDDPTGTAQLNRLRSELADLGALGNGVSFGVTVLAAEDAALEETLSLLTRARELAAQHANDLSTPAARQQAALEVEELERGLLTLANTRVAGRYVFAGLATGDAPFTQYDDPGFSPATAYTGSAESFSIRTGPDDVTTRLTTPGDQVFGDALAALDDLRVALEAGSSPTAELDALAAAADGISGERASIGGRARRLEDRLGEMANSVRDTKAIIGDVEDADLAEVATELTQIQTALNATLQSAQVLQTSILDYFRL